MNKKLKKIPPITIDTTLTNARKWLNIIRYNESGTVIQLQDDCEFRVLEIINNKNILKKFLGPFYKKYLLAYIPVDEQDLHEKLNFVLVNFSKKIKIEDKIISSLSNTEILEKIAEKGYEVGIFISHITPLLLKKQYQQLIDLEFLIRTSKNFSAVVFSELDITYDDFHILADKSSFLFDHIIKYPLYNNLDSKQFIAHYSQIWRFSISEKSIEEIIENCGGYLWLIHQVIRTLRDNPKLSVKDACSDYLIIKKLETIWKKFTHKEKNILRKIYLSNLEKEDTFNHEYDYLKSIRVIKETAEKIDLELPLLSKIIEKEMKLDAIHAKSNQIMIGKNNITNTFSNKERLFLILLILSKKRTVSRDVIAQTIWGEKWEEKYSDWAIDMLASRLRKKLKAKGIDKKIFRTVKKKGFIFG